jgi:hypothetical protein
VDNSADPDGDGVLDETCTEKSNADPVDFDQDGIDDACDGFVCGDGILQRAEACDPGIDPIHCSAPDDPNGGCLPIATLAISENAVNPDQNGVMPGYISAGATQIDPTTLRFAAVVDEDCRIDACIGGSQDANDCTSDLDCPDGGMCAGVGLSSGSYTDDQDGDGFLDLTIHFPVQGTGISLDTTDVCVEGAFENGATFDATDNVNVK